MYSPFKKVFLACCLLLIMLSCTKETDLPTIGDSEMAINLPNNPFNYSNPGLPQHLLDPAILNADNTPFNNPVTDHGATLGRVLFYDKNLSFNKTVACASCHQQDRGFSDPLVLSDGFEGGKTGRHSMGLTNARFYQNGRFFWDERAASLEEQVLLPMQDPVEMGMTLDSVVARVANLDYYGALFQNAFSTTEVTSENISKALAQFVRSMVSYQSPFDVGRAQANNAMQPFATFTQEENRGKQIFFAPNLGGCGVCHGTDAFIAPGPRSNGLDATITDAGVGGNTNNPNLQGIFKSPSLRNVAARAPYMHDGRFATLEEVVEHYNSGVQMSPNLHPALIDPNTNQPKILNLSTADKTALVAFLNTLDDNKMMADEKFSDPFF